MCEEPRNTRYIYFYQLHRNVTVYLINARNKTARHMSEQIDLIAYLCSHRSRFMRTIKKQM